MTGARGSRRKGCGIGCGILILAAGGIGTCSYLGIKKIKDRAEQLDAGFDALYADMLEHMKGGDYFVQDLRGGADPALHILADTVPTPENSTTLSTNGPGGEPARRGALQ